MKRAKDIEYLLSRLDSLDFWSRNEDTIDILGNGLYNLCCGDKEFSGKLHQIIYETRNRLEKEFDEL